MTQPDERVAGLARELEAYGRRLARVEQAATTAGKTARQASDDAEKIGRVLGELVDHLDQDDVDPAVAGGDEEPKDAHVSYLMIDDPEVALRELEALWEWLRRVFMHYPDADRAISDCLPYHAAAVEELRALRLAWLVAYKPKAGPQQAQRVADWHDRLLPRTVDRLTRSVGGCRLDMHVYDGQGKKAPQVAPEPPPAAMLPDLGAWWARSAGRSVPPQPSPAEVKAAEAQRVRP